MPYETVIINSYGDTAQQWVNPVGWQADYYAYQKALSCAHVDEYYAKGIFYRNQKLPIGKIDFADDDKEQFPKKDYRCEKKRRCAAICFVARVIYKRCQNIKHCN